MPSSERLAAAAAAAARSSLVCTFRTQLHGEEQFQTSWAEFNPSPSVNGGTEARRREMTCPADEGRAVIRAQVSPLSALCLHPPESWPGVARPGARAGVPCLERGSKLLGCQTEIPSQDFWILLSRSLAGEVG